MKTNRLILLFFIIIFITSVTFSFLSYKLNKEGEKYIGENWELVIPFKANIWWNNYTHIKKIILSFLLLQFFIVLIEYAQIYLTISLGIFFSSIFFTLSNRNLFWMLLGNVFLFLNVFSFGLNYAYSNYESKEKIYVEKIPYPSIFYYIVARISVSLIGASCCAMLGKEFQIGDVHYIFSNRFIISFSIIGLIGGWLATRGILEKVTIIFYYFFGNKENLEKYIKYSICILSILALFNLIISPYILPGVVLDLLGFPVLIIAILSGIKVIQN